MTLESLAKILRENGIVGAGGAGFPSYAKLSDRADTLILNCAECEPLLRPHRQALEKYAWEIMSTLEFIAEAVGADNIIIGVKKSYTEALEAVQANLELFKKIKIGLLPEIYPAGDEVVLIYETTGRIVRPGELPITQGVTVFNTETVLNIYNALNDSPVTHKLVTVTGEVENPVTLKAPIGTSFKTLLELAGGIKIKDYAIISGGPMTGKVTSLSDVVTKTTNAVIILPKEHYVVQKKLGNISISMKRAMGACCQCRICTDLCSRNLLGHPISPHMFMRTATSGITSDVKPFLNTMYCSGCGICEMYACGQNLAPRTLISEYKSGLRAAGVKPPETPEFSGVSKSRKHRYVHISRLISRLGLKKYDLPAPLDEKQITAREVRIPLCSGIGASAKPIVKRGETVNCGQKIAEAAGNALGVDVHASVSGKIKDVNEKYIIINERNVG